MFSVHVNVLKGIFKQKFIQLTDLHHNNLYKMYEIRVWANLNELMIKV